MKSLLRCPHSGTKAQDRLLKGLVWEKLPRREDGRVKCWGCGRWVKIVRGHFFSNHNRIA